MNTSSSKFLFSVITDILENVKVFALKKAKKPKNDWVDTQSEDTETCLNKSNDKKAYQLVKDQTLEKQSE